MSYLLDFLASLGFDASSPLSVFWFIFTKGGFIFVALALFIGLRAIWLDNRQTKYLSDVKWVYLAIDVPKLNEQSPKAVEQIFNQLWGALSGANFKEKWWQGKTQTNFSLEIVSIEGYIQYIIRTPKIFRDLIEASFYAQYPDIQITEIEDYTQDFTPDNFKKKGYELWGAQFGLANDEVYPIKTYPLFEHTIAQKIVDPLAALLEIFSRLGNGELAWFQINIKPVDDSWKEKSANEVKKLLGKEIKVKKTPGDRILDIPADLAGRVGDVVFGQIGKVEQEKKEDSFRMMNLTPSEREIIESIERKADKTGFKTKIRYVYLAKKESFFKPRGVSGLTGALRQFSLLNANGFKPAKGTATKSDIVFDKWANKKVYKIQRKILNNYKSRTQWGGTQGDGFILNVEELASIYHFPYADIVAPTVKRSEAKRAGAPFGLPVEGDFVRPVSPPETEEIKTTDKPREIKNNVGYSNLVKQASPPEDLPV